MSASGNQSDKGLWVPFWKPLAYSCAQDGQEVAFPDSVSELLTFLTLEVGNQDSEVRQEETGFPLEIRLGPFRTRELLISLSGTAIWWMVGVKAGAAIFVVSVRRVF